MPVTRYPTVRECFENPDLLLSLPPQILEFYKEQFVLVDQAVKSTTNVPPTPVLMALQHPRYQWMDTRHLHYLGDEIAAVVDEKAAAIVTMPPRHAKSHTCSVWTAFWYLAQHPEDQVLLISYEASFARKWGIKVRGLVEQYGADYGLRIDPGKTAGDDWSLITGGGMKCVGAMGGISGNPAKLLICDDLIKNDEEARSEIQRENLWDWWDGTVVQRIEPDTAVILIGTRYQEDDYLGRVLAHSVAGDGIKVREITLRAKAEADDPIDREIGEGLWTDHPLPGNKTWGQDYYDKREREVSPQVWSSVYQQRPSPPGGTKVDPAWWGWYLPNELPLELDDSLQTWDLALDALKGKDSKNAGLVFSRKSALIYLRDGFNAHSKIAQANLPGTGPEREKTVVGTMRSWNIQYPGAQYKLIERSLAGPFLADTMRAEMPGVIAWPPKGIQKGSKEACLDACIPTIRSGNVLLPLNRDGSKPEWAKELVEQCRAFGRHPYDDLVDALTQGMNFMLPSVRAALNQAQAEAGAHKAINSPADAHREALMSKIKSLMAEKAKRLKKDMDRRNNVIIPFGRTPSGLLSERRRRSSSYG